MPRFRFNLEDHRVIADRGLHDCEDIAQAQELADEIAERLVQENPDLVSPDFSVVVRGEDNAEVYRAPLDRDSIRKRRRTH